MAQFPHTVTNFLIDSFASTSDGALRVGRKTSSMPGMIRQAMGAWQASGLENLTGRLGVSATAIFVSKYSISATGRTLYNFQLICGRFPLLLIMGSWQYKCLHKACNNMWWP